MKLFRGVDTFARCVNALTSLRHYAVIAAAVLGMTVMGADNRNRQLHLLLDSCDYYQNVGNYNEALDCLHSFLRVAEADSMAVEPIDFSQAYILLGNIHTAYTDYVNARKYYLKGLEISRRHNQTGQLVKLYNNLTVVSCFLGDRENAERYNDLSMNLAETDNDRQLFDYTLHKAFIEKTFGDWQLSLRLMKQSIELAGQCGVDEVYISSPLSEIVAIYEEHEQLDSALFYLESYSEIAYRHNIPDMIVDVNKQYMRIYTRLGDSEKALYYQNRFFATGDSLMNTNRFLRNSGTFQLERECAVDRRIENLEFSISKRNLSLVAVCLGLVIAVVITVVVLFQKRKLKRLYLKLYEKNHEIVEKGNRLVDRSGAENVDGFAGLRDRIMKIMDETELWLDPDFSLARLAELTGSNTRYVSQTINDSFQKNFRTFINDYRIREACKRIDDTQAYGNITIQSVGESVGFRSNTNFISSFKRVTGLSPSCYRKIAKSAENTQE